MTTTGVAMTSVSIAPGVGADRKVHQVTSYNRELNTFLKEVISDLDNAIRKLDGFDYESLGNDRLGEDMSKVYQSLFAAGDAINTVRHNNLIKGAYV